MLTGLSRRVALGVLESLGARTRVAATLRFPPALAQVAQRPGGSRRITRVAQGRRHPHRTAFAPFALAHHRHRHQRELPRISNCPLRSAPKRDDARTVPGVETDLAALAGRLLHDGRPRVDGAFQPQRSHPRMVGIDRPVSLRWPTNAAPPRAGGTHRRSGRQACSGVWCGERTGDDRTSVGMIVESPPERGHHVNHAHRHGTYARLMAAAAPTARPFRHRRPAHRDPGVWYQGPTSSATPGQRPRAGVPAATAKTMAAHRWRRNGQRACSAHRVTPTPMCSSPDLEHRVALASPISVPGPRAESEDRRLHRRVRRRDSRG